MEALLLYLLLVVLTYLDTHTTKMCFSMLPFEESLQNERNPIARYIIKNWGFGMLNVLKTVALGVVGLAVFLFPNDSETLFLLLAVNILTFLVLCSNVWSYRVLQN